METELTPQKKWYKKIKYWLLIIVGLVIAFIVLALVCSKGIPMFKNLPKEVKEARLGLNGWGVEANAMVKIYLNNELAGEIQANEKGEFSVELNLNEGNNSVYAVAQYKGKDLKGSETTITYINQEKIDAQNKAKAEAEAAQEAQQKADAQVARQISEEETKAQEETVQQETVEIADQTTVTKQEENSVTTISRKEIINLFPEFTFSKEAEVDGKDNYVAQNSIFVIQLIGDVNSLEKISIMDTMNTNMANLTSAIDKKAEYLERIKNKLMPSLSEHALAILFNDGDTKQADGYDVLYKKSQLGGGTFTEFYIFKPTQ